MDARSNETETVSITLPRSLMDALRERALDNSDFFAWALELGIREGDAIEALIADEIAAYKAERRAVASRR